MSAVKLVEVESEMEAEIVLGLLRQAGISAHRERTGGRRFSWLDVRLILLRRPGPPLEQHVVMVDAADLTAAREVLDAPVEMPDDAGAEANANVQLTIASNAMEAEMICGLLRDSGIDAHYRSTSRNVAWSGGTDMFASQVVMVAERDLPAARRTLDAQPGDAEQQ